MLPENIQYILVFIGALTCLMMAICFLCATGLIVFLVWDGYTSRRNKAFNAKHQKDATIHYLPGFEQPAYIIKTEKPMTKDRAEELKQKFLGHPTYNPSPEVMAAREKLQNEEAVAVLKARLAEKPAGRHNEETQIYPAEVFPSPSFDREAETLDSRGAHKA